MRDIDNCDDVINSRTVLARIKELQDEIAPLQEELDSLINLSDQGERYAADWNCGIDVISDGYFEEYAKQYAGSVGVVISDTMWPFDCIDWSEAAEQLKQDFTSIDFDGNTYWVRS